MNLSSVLILTMLVLGSQAVPMERERRQADADAAVDPNVPESEPITSALSDVPVVPDAKEPAVEKQEAEVKPDESAKEPEAKLDKAAKEPEAKQEEPAKEPEVKQEEPEKVPEPKQAKPEKVPEAKQPEPVAEQKLGAGTPVDEGPISNDIIEDSKKVKEQPEDVKKPANHDPTSADNDGILGIPRALGNTINTLAGSWDNFLIVFNNLMRFLGINRD